MASSAFNGNRQQWDWEHLVQPERVHCSVYTDPNIFQEEMIRIFGGTWVYLAHESEIPNPDDFKTSHLGHRPNCARSLWQNPRLIESLYSPRRNGLPPNARFC